MSAIVLRPFQEQMVAMVRREFAHKHRVICVAPTGSGKRIMATWWSGQAAERGKRLLVVTNRRTLVWQMRDEMRERHVPYGMLMAGEPENPSAPIQIASLQTLRSRKWQCIPDCDGIVVDECHQEPDGYRELFAARPKALVLGFTATPVGPSGTSLLGDWDCIVEGVKNSTLIRQKLLLPTRVLAPSEPNIKGVTLGGGGEYNQSELGRRMESCTVFADVFAQWKPYRHMKTLVFAPLVKFARGLCEQFRERGIAAAVIEAETGKRERAELVDQFKDQGVDVLVSVDVLREGFDAPTAQCGIDLQPNNQFRTYWQKVGRVKRPHPGQRQAIWLDFAGNYWKFLHPNDDPEWHTVTGDKTANEMVQRMMRREQRKPWSCPKCFYTRKPGERIKGKCPGCGEDIVKHETVKRVRFGDGEIKEVQVSVKRKIKTTADAQYWRKCLYRVLRANDGTMNTARWLFKKEMGYWPESLPDCPPYDSGDWKRKVRAVCPWMARNDKQQ